MTRRKKTVIAVMAVCLVASLASFPPLAHGDELSDARARLARLQEEASTIGEEYNQVTAKLAEEKSKLARIDQDIITQEETIEGLRDQLAVVALQQFQDHGTTSTAVILTTSSQEEVLSRLLLTEIVTDTSYALLQNYQLATAQLEDLRRAQTMIVADVASDEVRLEQLKTTADQKVRQAQVVVNRLSAEQRARLTAETSSPAPSTPPPVPNGPAAQKIVAWAHARVGYRYCMGGVGPNCWDCSGFTMSAYSTVGIKLPHSASSQFRIGRSVSRGDLQPGDLVFFYGGPGHVGIYVGGGKIIDARNSRVGVVYTSINAGMPYTGARRLI